MPNTWKPSIIQSVSPASVTSQAVGQWDRRSVLAVIGGACVGLMGCPDGQPTEVAMPLQGTELGIVSPEAWKLQDVWEVMIHEWEAQTGAKVVFLGTEQKEQTSKLPQLLLAANDQLTALDEAKALSLFEPVGTDGEPRKVDLLNGLKQRLATRDQRLIAFPISQPVFLLYFRRDLLEKAGLKVPQTWAEYEALLAKRQEWAEDLPVLEPWGSLDRSAWLHAQLVPLLRPVGDYSTWFDIRTGESNVSQNVAEHFFQKLSKRWSQLGAESASLSATGARAKVLSGEAALAIGYEPYAHPGVSAPVEDGKTTRSEKGSVGEIGVAMLPAASESFDARRKAWIKLGTSAYRPALVGFGGWSLTFQNSQKANIGALSSLFELLTITRPDEAFPGISSSLTQESQTLGLSKLATSGLNGTSASEAFDAIAQCLRSTDVTAYLPVVQQERFVAATQQAIEQFFKSPEAPEQAAKVLVEGFAQSVAAVGAKEIRASYCRSLGLLAD